MKVIIAGGRNFKDYELLKRKCDQILSNKIKEDLAIVSGEAPGADTLGEKYAESISALIKPFPAEWEKYGKAAGPVRNRKMAEYSDALIIFWDGKSTGSQSMIKVAKELDLKIRIVRYD